MDDRFAFLILTKILLALWRNICAFSDEINKVKLDVCDHETNRVVYNLSRDQ